MMMRRMNKGVALLLLTAVIGAQTGCGTGQTGESEATQKETDNTAAVSETETEAEGEIEKPEKITVLYDMGTLTQTAGLNEWIARWEELTGIELELITPDHDAYTDIVGQTFASGPENWPDVIMLSATEYCGYANEGAFWDMTEAWNNSELKKSGNVDTDIVEANMLDGHLYGFSKERGNGCITYIKKSWLDNCGLEAPTNYEEYLNMLDAFTNGDPDGNGINGDTYGVSAAGLLGTDGGVSTTYLPEIYQDAYPTFYQKEDGTWVDGFTEDAMKDAIERLKYVYEQGYLDRETLTNGTSDCRNKFFEDKFGVFTYWAGSWASKLKTNLESNGLDGELVVLEPIEELDHYIERNATVMCITTSCENPEGVWKYFIESTCDGGDMQILWTYGVEGVHWSTQAETVCGNTYQEGEFHMLENPDTPGAQFTNANTDPLLTIRPMENDPGKDAVLPEARESQEIFNANSQVDELPVTSDERSQYNGDLITLKRSIVTDCVVNGLSVEEGYARFQNEHGQEWSDLIVDSLNRK